MGTLSKNLSLTLLHAKGQGQGQMTLQFENEPLDSVNDYIGPASFSSSVTWIYTKLSRWDTRAVIFQD